LRYPSIIKNLSGGEAPQRTYVLEHTRALPTQVSGLAVPSEPSLPDMMMTESFLSYDGTTAFAAR
jgi:hypothetical protein